MGSEPVELPTDEPPVEGVDRSEWHDLLERGRGDGELLAEDVAHVLRHVELTADALQAVHASLSGHGIAVDDAVDDDVDEDVTPPAGAPRSVVLDDEDVERLLTRRRRRRGQKRAVRVEGGTSDTVRLYLREIGQVDLLSTEDERRLAQLIEEGHQAAQRIDEGVDDPGRDAVAAAGSAARRARRRASSRRRTCASSSASPSATRVAACSCST